MSRCRPNHYLKTARLSACLTQAELGALLGVSVDVVGNVERDRTIPSLAFVLGCTLLFGKSSEKLFPYLYNTVQEELGHRAAILDRELRGQKDRASGRKRACLSAMAKRTTSFDL